MAAVSPHTHSVVTTNLLLLCGSVNGKHSYVPRVMLRCSVQTVSDVDKRMFIEDGHRKGPVDVVPGEDA